MRLIHKKLFELNALSRKKFAKLLRHNHQIVEPTKTPAISENASIKFPLFDVKPKPAKIAVKDKIVIGLVKVRNNVDP